MATIYRGYDITDLKTEFKVLKDGHEHFTAASEERALNWVDQEVRRLRSISSSNA